MKYIDAAGTWHKSDPAARIVSLVPSITEMLCDFGLAPQLVGRTGFCIHPQALVAPIAKVGGTKDVNLDKIRGLAPSHVIVNIDENTLPVANALASFVPHVVVTHPCAPRDNLALANLLGGIFGVEDSARQWCDAFQQEYAALQAIPSGPARRIVYCIWRDPWMTVSSDTYIARMMAEVNWTVPVIDAPNRYPVLSWTPELLQEVDGVLLSSEPYRFKQADADALARQIDKPVLLIDGEMMSWYGTRALAGLRYLAALKTHKPFG